MANTNRKGTTRATNKGRTHGGYAAATRYRERGLDLRRRDDRALKEWQDAVIADCGGLQEMDTFQLSMLNQATECKIITREMGRYAKEEGIINKETGQLIGCLRNSYLSYSKEFRRALDKLYGRNGKKPRAPSLAEYLEETYGSKERPNSN
jgi:hypothetical protein